MNKDNIFMINLKASVNDINLTMGYSVMVQKAAM